MSVLPIDPRFDVDVRTPALVVDLDCVEANVRTLASRTHAAGQRFLPHAKTHRIVDLAAWQLAWGADGLCVATTDEAQACADAGLEPIFIGYPVAGRGVPEQVRALAQQVELSVGVDNLDAARALSMAMIGADRPLEVLIAIDVGNHREGVAPDQAVKLAREVARLDGLHLTGIFAHEGHVYAAADHHHLAALSQSAGEMMRNCAEALRRNGFLIDRVSLGASASSHALVGADGITELRPGINTFNDAGQISLGLATPQTTAARVLASVTSVPEPGRACSDAGSKTLGKDANPATAMGPAAPEFGMVVNAPEWRIHGLSEEHGWLRPRTAEVAALRPGDRLEIIPNHICVAFAMCQQAIYLRNGAVVGVESTIPRTLGRRADDGCRGAGAIRGQWTSD